MIDCTSLSWIVLGKCWEKQGREDSRNARGAMPVGDLSFSWRTAETLLRKVFISRARGVLERLLESRVDNPENLVSKLLKEQGVKQATLYIHIPFCIRPCKFCCFVRTAYNVQLYKEYKKALMHELENYCSIAGDVISSIYIGGGTPTINREGLLEILDYVQSSLGEPVEISVEAHPATIDREYAKELRKAGVSRLSIGVQSFNKETLERLGRTTCTPELSRKAIREVAGVFPTLNADLISSVPGQSVEEVTSGIDWLTENGCNEVTVYPLLMAWGSKASWSESERQSVDYSHFRTIYNHVVNRGLRLMTTWCYALSEPKLIDEYFIDTTDYLGAGMSSIGKIGNIVYTNTFDIRRYIELVRRKGFSARACLRLGETEDKGYRLLIEAFSLRVKEEHIAITGDPIVKILSPVVKRFFSCNNGFCEPKGFQSIYLIHTLMKDFLEGIAWLRLEAIKRGV